MGTSWRNDPAEEMVLMSLAQTAWTSPAPPELVVDFMTAARVAIDD